MSIINDIEKITKRKYENIKDRLLDKARQYYEQNKDNIRQHYNQNKHEMIEKNQQYREQNKYICTCICGSNVQKINMTKHMKTIKT